MTYEELLAKIDPRITRGAPVPQYEALRAVVELHFPVEQVLFSGDTIIRCFSCGPARTETSAQDKYFYPCETIEIIEKELA